MPLQVCLHIFLLIIISRSITNPLIINYSSWLFLFWTDWLGDSALGCCRDFGESIDHYRLLDILEASNENDGLVTRVPSLELLCALLHVLKCVCVIEQNFVAAVWLHKLESGLVRVDLKLCCCLQAELIIIARLNDTRYTVSLHREKHLGCKLFLTALKFISKL